MEKLESQEPFVVDVINQMLDVVDYLQRKKIAHRDIKP